MEKDWEGPLVVSRPVRERRCSACEGLLAASDRVCPSCGNAAVID